MVGLRVFLEEQIGMGCQAQVFKGTMNERPVAVKIYAKPNASAQGEKAVFSLNPAQMGKNLVRTLHVCKTDSAEVEFYPRKKAVALLDGPPRPLIVMELVERDLTSCLNGASLADKLRWCLQLTNAVEKLNANLIVHKDVKPSNCMIDHSGTLKLVDFGYAVDLREEPEFCFITSSGTPRYQPPELLRSKPIKVKRNLASKIDIYSLALSIWEIISGETPFSSASSLTDLREAVLSKSFGPSFSLLPPSLCPILESALSPNPLDRPSHSAIRDQLLLLSSQLQL